MDQETRLDSLEKRIRFLEEKLAASLHLTITKESLATNGKTFLCNVEMLAAQLQISDMPQFFVGAVPLNPTDLPSLFAGRSEPIVKLFETPPQTREDGFGLFSGQHRFEIVDGEAGRIVLSSQARHIARDGKFTAVFKGDDNFLGWAMRPNLWKSSSNQPIDKSPYRINSIVIAEATFESISLAKKIFEFAVPPISEIQYFIGYRNLLQDGQGPLLLNGKADANMHQRPLVGSKVGEHLASLTASSSESAERVSLRLVAEIYHLFGLMDDLIPYSVSTSEGRVIDPATF